MNCFIRIFTASAILVHAVVGCCVHHGYADDTQIVVTNGTHEYAHSHETEHQHQHSNASTTIAVKDTKSVSCTDCYLGNELPARHKCCGSKCKTINTCGRNCAELTSSFSQLFPIACGTAPVTFSLGNWCAVGSLPYNFFGTGPVRAHLCHCVLLI